MFLFDNKYNLNDNVTPNNMKSVITDTRVVHYPISVTTRSTISNSNRSPSTRPNRQTK